MTAIYSPVNTKERGKLQMRAGDTVRVWQKIQEKGKTRLQAFEGLVIARKHGTEAGATFTVRKVASGVGVEKIFPLYSPNIDKIEIVRRAKVRRSKLYYIREKSAKAIRRKMRGLADFLPVSYKEGEHSVDEEPTTDNSQPTTSDESAEEVVAEETTEASTETEKKEEK